MRMGVERFLINTNSKLVIDEAYLDLVPRPTDQERKSLKFSIIENGQQIPIIANEKSIILDGHTRAEICEELHIKPKYKIKKFESDFEERKFVIMVNLARRNLTTFGKIEMAWELYEMEKIRAKRRVEWKKHYPDLAKLNKKGQVITVKEKIKEGTAAQIFAKHMDLGKNTISYTAYIIQFADEKLLEQLRSGEMSINKAFALLQGLKFMRTRKRKPKTKPEHCGVCGEDVAEKKKCHVHKWYCCTRCKWGI